MKSFFGILLISLTALGVISCAEGNGELTLEEKKAKLDDLRSEYRTMEREIKDLEGQIAIEDPSFVKENEVLVSTNLVNIEAFEHKIEVRGSVKSRKNVSVSAEVMGRIDYVYAKLGDKVKKGQKLAKLDAETLSNQIAELQTAYDLAQVVYNRQKNLWDNKIGSEIQYLEAKNNKEMLERQLKTARTQLAKATIVAPFEGNVDEVFIKQGEMAQPGLPMFRVISFEDMYIDADISERFIARFKVGDQVKVSFPALERTLTSTIASVGNVINEKNRTFKIEIRLPSNSRDVKPNLTAVLEMVDYSNDAALVVPTNLIQKDATGDFVYLVNSNAEKATAKKVHISRGVSYKDRTEVVDGIEEGVQIIDKGHRDVADGLAVKIVN